MNNYGKGLYIDLHGQSHTPKRIDVGYNISISTLDAGILNNTIEYSSINNLKNNNIQNLSLDDLVRGTDSFGSLLQTTGGNYYNTVSNGLYQQCGRSQGYRAVPSNYNNGGCDDTTPNGSAYFAGNYYSNILYGSGNPSTSTPLVGGGSLNGGGGTIDGMMVEVNRDVRHLGNVYGGSTSYNRTDTKDPTLFFFAQDYANVIINYIDAHYNDFTAFSYTSTTYDVTDTNPTPIITGFNGGQFSSTPTGLSLNSITGVIDLANSIPGNYNITYTSRGYNYYQSTVNIEITDNTLSNTKNKPLNIAFYPNPSTGVLNFDSNIKVDTITFYDISGKKVDQFSIDKNKLQLDISKLNEGSYIAMFSFKDILT